MARICPTCGRPKGPEFHDEREDMQRVINEEGEFEVVGIPVGPGQPIRWLCRMTLVATSPKTGKLVPTHIAERVKEIDNRYVHNDRLEQDG